MKSILLISPYPPAQNPRLLKEYYAFKTQNYHVKVLFGERDKWASTVLELNSDFICVGGAYRSFLYFTTRVVHKFLKAFLPLEFSYDRVSWLLFEKAKTIKADLFIAHNLAALPIAVKVAKIHTAKCGFDAEDFHRQEVTDDKSSFEYRSAKYLEDKYLPLLDYFTAASPLIAKEYKKLYPNLVPQVINNVFPAPQNLLSFQNLEGLRLFWFSQTVGKGRGLEDVIKAMGMLRNENISFTLLGNITGAVKEYLMELAFEHGLLPFQLVFLEPVAPDAIFQIASQFDIGMALEQNIPYNRDICLTNKIFTYMNAGLAVIASETAAQKLFLLENPTIGQSFAIGDVKKLAETINSFYNRRQYLSNCKSEALKLANEKYNWEIESKKLMEVIKIVI